MSSGQTPACLSQGRSVGFAEHTLLPSPHPNLRLRNSHLRLLLPPFPSLPPSHLPFPSSSEVPPSFLPPSFYPSIPSLISLSEKFPLPLPLPLPQHTHRYRGPGPEPSRMQAPAPLAAYLLARLYTQWPAGPCARRSWCVHASRLGQFATVKIRRGAKPPWQAGITVRPGAASAPARLPELCVCAPRLRPICVGIMIKVTMEFGPCDFIGRARRVSAARAPARPHPQPYRGRAARQRGRPDNGKPWRAHLRVLCAPRRTRTRQERGGAEARLEQSDERSASVEMSGALPV